VAHGVEPPEERAAHGKPALATVAIRARQDGNSLVLEVSDDGRGIDTAALSRRLVATGRWTTARARLADDADVLEALLNTGVSTRGEADELAGRGVGIGLVRQTVAKLGGEVKVVSTAGKGTTFTLRVPLSTALAQAMLFKVDGQVYAVSSVNVPDTTFVDASATVATVRKDPLPVVRLEQLLGHGAATERRPAIVVTFAGKSLVCTVDKIIGAREIVIKPLGPLLAPLTLYAGATISGSGKVQLILDPAQLVRRAHPDVPAVLTDPTSAPMILAGRALVVDDSRAIREAMTSMLGSEGWIVDVAEDGRPRAADGAPAALRPRRHRSRDAGARRLRADRAAARRRAARRHAGRRDPPRAPTRSTAAAPATSACARWSPSRSRGASCSRRSRRAEPARMLAARSAMSQDFTAIMPFMRLCGIANHLGHRRRGQGHDDLARGAVHDVRRGPRRRADGVSPTAWARAARS